MEKTQFTDESFMKAALREAHTAFEKGEIPVGAVVVCNNRIIARTHNLTEALNDPTAHAEMQAITSAGNYLGGKYLQDCSMYVTLEPCIMCAGAIFWSRLGRLIYGTADEKRGFTRINKNVLHKNTEVLNGIMESECREILLSFFKSKRKELP